MTYPPLKLVDRRVRERAKVIIDTAPDGYVVRVSEPTRLVCDAGEGVGSGT